MALIDIGSRKQLFVDDYLIESMDHCVKTMNRAEKVPGNPVLRAEHPWEGRHLIVDEVWWDDEAGRFEMRYSARTWVGRRVKDEVLLEEKDGSRTCLAVSEDGIEWEKPVVGEVEFEGSKQNNILPSDWLMGYTYPDPNASDEKRFRGHVRAGDTRAPGMTMDLYTSPDFKSWTPYVHNPIIDTSPKIGRWGPTSFMGWDPIREVYAVHLENSRHRRSPLGKRLIGRAESPDGIVWSEPETILVPDAQDPPDTEFYSMPCTAYEGLYVGLLWIFRTTNTTHHPEVVFSRDGIHYERNYRQPFIERGGGSDFDSISVYAKESIVVGDQIYTFYNGRNWRSHDTLIELGDGARADIGLAVSRLDGFVSVDGTKALAGDPPLGRPHFAEYSELVTRSFSFTGSQLHLNLASAPRHGGAGPCEVRVEILEPYHDYIPGYAFEDADPIEEGGLDQVTSWNGSSDLSRLEGQPVKLRFYFRNAKLYSFQFR